ncbi:MAG: hypothetical protein IOD12_06265 [Silvanigrellales bacterium]|jgi:hypothetical protein|nr:hypothetical protein [Silvanigrellales bacterium]
MSGSFDGFGNGASGSDDGHGDISGNAGTSSGLPFSGQGASTQNVTPITLRLVAKKIPIRFAEYRISTNASKMITGDTISVSNLGVLLGSALPFPKGALMRVWMEMPDYWARKARHVGYRHTEAPSFFQVLVRVVACDETGKRNAKYQILCQTVNLDPIDELVLCDYLGLTPTPRGE